MITKCPRCGYERKPTDSALGGQCPSCGIDYAKFLGQSKPKTLVRKSVEVAEKSSPTDESRLTQDDSILKKYNNVIGYIAVGVICMLIGYFSGREHLKYELRSTLQVAAEEMQRNLAKAFGKGNSETPPTESPKSEKDRKISNELPAFNAELVKKGFMEANYQAGVPKDAITFTVKFANLTGKDIRAFDGVLKFTDLLDNKIINASLAINEPLAADSKMEWHGQLDFNQFISEHQRLRTEDLQNLKIVFSPRKILFEDGTTKEYQ